MKHLLRAGSALVLSLLFLFGCMGIAASAETDNQTTAIAMVKEQLQAEKEKALASTKALWFKEMLSRTEVTDVAAGEPDKKGAIPVTVTVTYPTLHTGLDAKSKYDGKDAEAFVQAALETAKATATYEIKATVSFPEGKDAALKWDTKAGFPSYKTALTAKAKAANTSFGVKAMVSAMADFVLQHPSRGAKLKFSSPNEVTLTATAPNFESMLYAAMDSTVPRIAYEAQGPNTEMDAMYALMDEQIAAYSVKYAKAKKLKSDKAVSLAFDPWKLAENAESSPEVNAYRQAYQSEYDTFKLALIYRGMQLPDLPALEMPETKRLEGGKSGTKVVIKATKGDGNCMVRFLKDGEVKALGFIRDGERLTVYLRGGEYTMQLGSGSIWYGNEELFGPEPIGIYSYDQVRITSKEGYYHTFTFSTVQSDDKNAMDSLDRDALL